MQGHVGRYEAGYLRFLKMIPCVVARDIVVHWDSLLGSGATGVVYQGSYQDMEVAVKVST